jgi:serine/threonine-protein kinase/endoribonuclease IRE1
MRSKQDEEGLSQLDNTFVGTTANGGWYALSEANFPYVTRQASNAGCYEKAGPWKSLPAPEREKALVGIHKIHYAGPDPVRASLPAPAAYEDASGRSNSNESPRASNPSLTGVPIVGTATASTGYFMPGTIFLAILWFLTIAKIAHHQFDLPLSRSAIASKFFNSSPSGPVAPLLATEAAKSTTTLTNVETPVPPVLQPVEEKPEEQRFDIQTPSDKDPEDQKPEELKPEEPELGKAKDHAAVMPAVRFQEPEPAKESTSGISEENREIAAPPTTPTKKKKYQRGRRGGKKKSNGSDNGNTPANGSSAVEKVENVGQVFGTTPGRIKITADDGTEMEIRPPLVLNNLTIYEDVLLGKGFPRMACSPLLTIM